MTPLIALDNVLRKWQRQNIILLPPVKEADVIARLRETGRNYSRDVIALYCATGGMKDGETDSHAWSLWSLNRVISESLGYDRPYILFADFLIDSHLYCFRYESDDRSSVCVDYFNGEEPALVADSVSEFFELYLRSPRELEMFE